MATKKKSSRKKAGRKIPAGCVRIRKKTRKTCPKGTRKLTAAERARKRARKSPALRAGSRASKAIVVKAAKRKKPAKRGIIQKLLGKKTASRKTRRNRLASGEVKLVCRPGESLIGHHPKTGAQLSSPMCSLRTHQANGNVKITLRRPSRVDQRAIACNKGYTLMTGNPNTGKFYNSPRCVMQYKNGRIKTHAPRRERAAKALTAG